MRQVGPRPSRVVRSSRARPERSTGIFDGLFSQVHWTPAFIGLLLYVFAVVTYRAPVAMPGMLIALAAIILGGSKIRIPPVLIAFGLFIAWGAVGYMYTSYTSFVADRLVLLGKLWLIAFVIVNALRTPAQVRLFVVFFLVCFATHPARGAIFNYFYGHTLVGRAIWNHIFGNPNDLAALTLLPLGLAIGLLKDPNAWVRRGALTSVVVLISLILMTQSRGGFLALALVAVIVVFNLPTGRRRVRTLLGIAMIAVTATMLAPSGVWDRVSGLSEGTDADSSSRQRWEIWEVAREIASDHKVFGVGYGAYPRMHYQYTINNPRFVLSRGTRDTHSTYLNVLAEGGWPGLVLFLTMFAIGLNEARRARKRLRHAPAQRLLVGAVAMVLIGYLAAGIFGTFPQLAFLYLHLALLSVISSSALAPRGRRRRRWSQLAASPPLGGEITQSPHPPRSL